MQEFKLDELIAFAEQFSIPFYDDLRNFQLVLEEAQVIPYSFAKQKGVVPLSMDEKTLKCAFMHPDYDKLKSELKLLTGKNIECVLAPKEIIYQTIEKCYNSQSRDHSVLQAKNNNDFSQEDVDYDLSDDFPLSEVVGFLNHTLIQALRKKASDIHFDPSDEKLLIRMRIDGVLVFYSAIAKEFSKQLTTRIKVLSKLDISEGRLPQDGRIKVRYAAKEIDFRVSTLPTVHGERVVLRILDNSQVVLGLQESGMNPAILEDFRSHMLKAQGLILVTGPTGSGKTSTLYGAISELNAKELNIMTIEDPVEFKLRELSQISVNHKIDFTFSKGLRHILRQDPDVIMVGEIRDRETAEIAIQAALTGHLVVSTLHTNDAASALTRLTDMGIEPFLISSCVTGVLAQRLIRKICPFCKQEDQPSFAMRRQIGITDDTVVYCGKGCEHCFGLGFQGRIGIFEWMPMTGKIKSQLMLSQDSHPIFEIAKSEGMQTLKEDGRSKILSGVSSVEEVLKAVP